LGKMPRGQFSGRFLSLNLPKEFIMLPNEIFALECLQRYAESGDIVDASNGEFAHCPLPKGMGDTGYYLLHQDHQCQGLLQSRDVGRCCFFPGHAKKWLMELDWFPDDYFKLWDIYEKYFKMQCREAGKKGAEKIHAEKNEEGKSVVAVKAGKKAAEKLNAEKDELGRSVNSMRNLEKLHNEKDENGKSVNAIKGCEKMHAEKNEEGKSVVAVKAGTRGAKTFHAQVWESTIDGFRSHAAAVANYNRARGWDPTARIRIS
jgi:hypothetical protein